MKIHSTSTLYRIFSSHSIHTPNSSFGSACIGMFHMTATEKKEKKLQWLAIFQDLMHLPGRVSPSRSEHIAGQLG